MVNMACQHFKVSVSVSVKNVPTILSFLIYKIVSVSVGKKSTDYFPNKIKLSVSVSVKKVPTIFATKYLHHIHWT